MNKEGGIQDGKLQELEELLVMILSDQVFGLIALVQVIE